MLSNGWNLHKFDGDKRAIKSLLIAKEVVDELRKAGNYARIVAGLVKTIQHEKHFSIIFKKKIKNDTL